MRSSNKDFREVLIAMKAVLAFVRREAVLCIALVCAAASCFFVPPSAEYLSYIDARVLALLFCLIAAVAGLSKAGLMRRLSSALLARAKDGRHLALLLSLSCFFLAMFVTNDVSLITFVPLTVMILQQAGLADLMIPVVTLETIAANLGSALTPVGNPQNLYLYTAYSLSPGVFFSITVPLCAVSLFLLLLFLLTIPRKPFAVSTADAQEYSPLHGRELVLHGVLFVLCLLAVFSVLSWQILLGVVLAALLLFDREIFRRVDYALLLTFVCFFIFSGNLSRIPAVRELLTNLMEKSAFFASLLSSQIISNVPAALLLRPFTDNAAAMILGTDVGGLGTLVASLASLISYKAYLRAKGANGGRYLAYFTVVNLLFLLPLIALSLLLLRG